MCILETIKFETKLWVLIYTYKIVPSKLLYQHNKKKNNTAVQLGKPITGKMGLPNLFLKFKAIYDLWLFIKRNKLY